jgi:hypothetical protein
MIGRDKMESSMEYTIRHNEDQTMVVAKARGDWDSHTDNAMVREIMETVEACGSMKVLLDIQELHFEFPIVYLLDRVQEMKKQRQDFKNVSRRVAIAYSSTDEKIDENLMFFEAAARNRSLPCQTFIDMNKAMAWLQVNG